MSLKSLRLDAKVFLVTVLTLLPSLALCLTPQQFKTRERSRSECENGIGKSCYRLALDLQKSPVNENRKLAQQYFVRSCQLKVDAGCLIAHKAKSVSKTRRTYAQPRALASNDNIPNGPCFKSNDFNTAFLSPPSEQSHSKSGQMITVILQDSIWSRIGFEERDILQRVNNQKTNSPEETKKILSPKTKYFSFQVERDGIQITLWYRCR